MTARLKSTPLLSVSQLASRIDLAQKRLSHYRMDKGNFNMIDIERTDTRYRCAHCCTGNLSGSMLEFLSCADGIDGKQEARLEELFECVLRAKRPAGLFGACHASADLTIEEHVPSWSYRLSNGLIKYFDLTGDSRALDAATQTGDRLVNNKSRFFKAYEDGAAYPMEFLGDGAAGRTLPPAERRTLSRLHRDGERASKRVRIYPRARLPRHYAKPPIGGYDTLWFSPLCSAISNLSLYDTPILFDRI